MNSLSASAEADLIAIYDFTETTFSEYKAKLICLAFDRTFGLLTDFPGIGQAVDELRAGYRRFRFQSHFVFYTAEADGIVIRAFFTPRATCELSFFP